MPANSLILKSLYISLILTLYFNFFICKFSKLILPIMNKGLEINFFFNFQLLKIISDEILFGSPAIIAIALVID